MLQAVGAEDLPGYVTLMVKQCLELEKPSQLCIPITAGEKIGDPSRDTKVRVTIREASFNYSPGKCSEADQLDVNITVKTFGLLQPNFGHLNCMPVLYVTHKIHNFDQGKLLLL